MRALKYGEGRLIVDIFTAAWGRITVAAKIASGARGRSRRLFFQPLTVLSLGVDYRPNRDVQTLGEVSIAHAWTSLTLDPVKMTVGMFLAEVMYHATRQSERDDMLYAFMADSLRWLDESEAGAANFHLVFMLHLTQHLGFLPSPEDYAPGAYFDLRSGEFTANAPLHPEYLGTSEARAMHSLLRMTYANMHLFRMSRAGRQRVLDIILAYYRIHLPSFPELKSLKVLHQVFD